MRKINNSRIIQNKEIKKNYWLMEIEFHNANKIFLPGQFIEIEVSSSLYPIFRRPFSIFDVSSKSFFILYKKIGIGTKLLSEHNFYINFIGPLGISYPFNNNHYKNILIIGGGTGVASVYYLAQYLFRRNISFNAIFGFKNKEEFYLNDYIGNLQNCFFATDDGSFSYKGFVTDYISDFEAENTIYFICGPKKMIQKSYEIIKKLSQNNKIYGSFEEYMACGFGVCNGCSIKIKNNDSFTYKKICTDGPIFDLEEVLWD